MQKFYRLSETVNKKSESRVVSVTIKPILKDMSGIVWLTDLMLQEGDRLTGFLPHTETLLKKHSVDGAVREPVWYNAIVRGRETLILFNLGKTSAGLDIKLYPKTDLAEGSVTLAQGVGGQWAHFPGALLAGDELEVDALNRPATKNGQPFTKEGFYQYSAAWDSKHIVDVGEKKSARLLFTLQEMEDGGDF